MDYVIPEGTVSINYIWTDDHVLKEDINRIICPSSLRRIDYEAFSNCRNLEEIVFNEGLKEITGAAFSLNSKIKELTFPSSLKKIGSGSFWSCTNLTEVNFNDNLEEIKVAAFVGCKIKEIIIPNSVKKIDIGAFYQKNVYCCLEKVIIGSKSPIAKLSEDELKERFGPNANIIIKKIDTEIDYNLFNNIKRVSDEERNRLGLELFDEINKDKIDMDKVQELLINGADTEIRDSNGNTGLMLMIKKGNNEVSKMYLLSKSDVNARNKLKETPLILASRNNNNNIAFELIDRNCIVNAMTVFDESALSIAYDNGNIELVSRLENILNISSKEKELEEVQKVRKKVFGK